MGRTLSQFVSFGVVMLLSAAAWAGSSGGGAGPAGDQGSSGAEPEMIALILFCSVRSMGCAPMPVVDARCRQRKGKRLELEPKSTLLFAAFLWNA